MNSKQYRAEGYATIFRNGHVYLIRRDAPTHARVHPVRFGRWMDCPIEDMGWTALADLTAPLRDDIRAALAACYCDQGNGLCDFCGNVRRPTHVQVTPVDYEYRVRVYRDGVQIGDDRYVKTLQEADEIEAQARGRLAQPALPRRGRSSQSRGTNARV